MRVETQDRPAGCWKKVDGTRVFGRNPTTQLVGWTLDIYNHEVVATQSPGLRYSATLGDGVVPRLPNGI
jgi:hypothetical protein